MSEKPENKTAAAAAVFFEIRGEIGHGILAPRRFSDGVDERRVFSRSHRERGGESVEFVAVRRGIGSRGGQPQRETDGAPVAALGEIFHAADGREELVFALFGDYESHAFEMRKKQL